ncbi:Flp family type IVb pilin [Amorphus sp. MBR-141]
MNKFFARFSSDETGGGLVEYALIVALIALGSITAMTTLGGNINSKFADIGTTLTSVNTDPAAQP